VPSVIIKILKTCCSIDVWRFFAFPNQSIVFSQKFKFQRVLKIFSVFEISILKDKISLVGAKVCLHWRSGVGQNATFHDSCKKQQLYSVTTTSRIYPNQIKIA
jgi:hypothetical protein